MKKLYSIFVIIAGALILASCNKREPAITSVTPSVIGSVPAEELVISEIMKERDTLFVLNWTPAKFKTSSGSVDVAPLVNYIEFDAYGNGFANAAAYSIIQGEVTSLAIPVMDFSVWVLANIKGAKAGSATKIEVRIKTKYGDGENYTYSNNAPVITINPFGSQPMFIIGDRNDWDTSDKTYRMFRNNNDESDFTMTYTGMFKSKFKLISKGSLGTQDMYYMKSGDSKEGTMGAGIHEGDEFTVPSEGIYTITIDLMSMTYKITPYSKTPKKFTSVGFMGQWCEWVTNSPKAQMTASEYDPHIWSGTFDLTTVDYGVKFCGNLGWGDKWQPDATKTEEIPFGIAEYNKDIAGDPNFSLGTATGTYFVMLNDITGHYIIEKQ